MTDFDSLTAQKNPQTILTVSQLNRMAKDLLQSSFPLTWISGEISNFTRAASGHWYFSLKDAGAQVSCVMFKGRNSYVDFLPQEGDKVEARATVTLYEARGSFQLVVESVQRAGLGALFAEFEKLKAKLEHEGLFDPAFKQAIPDYPKTIGVVTSKDAAALRDVLTTLNRRNPNIKVIIYPTPVQGHGADKQIANAIKTANARKEVDTLIICRGGGSLEDLWQFNEEIVARAIDECEIPTISGVGHETDFTICDFVADLRAATPTAAAEQACFDLAGLQYQVTQLHTQLKQRMQQQLNQRAQHLDYLSRRLISPAQQLQNQQAQLKQLVHRLQFAVKQHLQTQQQKVLRLSENLAQLNPENVLSRGYALVQDSQQKVITDSAQLSADDAIQITLSQGSAEAQVIRVKN